MRYVIPTTVTQRAEPHHRRVLPPDEVTVSGGGLRMPALSAFLLAVRRAAGRSLLRSLWKKIASFKFPI
jgi:hypothetical protein